MSDPLNPLGRTVAAPAVRPRPRASGASGVVFDVSVPEDVSTAADVSSTGAVGTVNPMLLHELAMEAGEHRDREARRHGKDVLDLLGELQRELLRGDVETSAMERLAGLVADPPQAADPGLAAVTRAIVLRARIETARREARRGVQE